MRRSLILLLCAMTLTTSVFAQQPVRTAPETAVKAAMLLKFLELVRWPAAAPSQDPAVITVCTFDDDWTAVLQQSVGGRSVGTRRVRVEHVTRADQVSTCAALFVTVSGSMLPAAMRRYAKLPLLTVGDAEGFVHAGGVIGFRTEAGRVRFDVNERAATEAGLTLDPRLVTASQQSPRPGGR